jgi:hypothetical protein
MLDGESQAELAHHLLKARIFKSSGTNNTNVSGSSTAGSDGGSVAGKKPDHYHHPHALLAKDLHPYWLCLCSNNNLSSALADKRNVFWPNIKVIRNFRNCLCLNSIYNNKQ